MIRGISSGSLEQATAIPVLTGLGPLPLTQGSLTCKQPQTQPTSGLHRGVICQHCLPSVTFQQFQVLFNSLFKVLFIFPSRYLFAIGLPPIFSFRWNLPPSWSCNPKQLDSLIAGRFIVLEAGVNGAVTLLGGPFQSTLPAQLFRTDIYRLQLRRFSV